MRARSLLLAAALAAAFAGPSPAQQFPSKPIALVVPYAAGGNVDVSARILQAGIGDALGQPIIIENRPGAGGTIAGDYVARSAPDGHTLFVGSNGPILLGPMTMPKPPYQWDKAFAPVSSLAFATNMLLVRPTLPVKSVAELVGYARANPGKLTLATIERRQHQSLHGRAAEAEGRHHLDRGALPRQRAGHQRSVAGHVDIGLQQLVDSLQQIQAGKLRALAVLGPKRVAAVPDVPTIERRVSGRAGRDFQRMFAPKATPRGDRRETERRGPCGAGQEGRDR